ncbi:hypothetical protein PVAP13_3NG293488 [Panicum virgatum]|uniref:Uncharacterized protein n=1 Tax=Panicum virgatum TaxID=38727 RepID=A0A8T0UNS8_PANVG|nr:hypothetical protein PVAP13_3NG293488 [Panicum virgatum]
MTKMLRFPNLTHIRPSVSFAFTHGIKGTREVQSRASMSRL